MPYLELNDISLYYEEQGEGDPLLLIAGLASDSRSWGPVAAELSAKYRVITVDNRGTGRTTPGDAAMSIDAMADDCMALVRHLGLPGVNLSGHSMGGLVAQQCAITCPKLVDRLILVATSPRISRRNLALFADWAESRESGMDMRLWFRNIFFWIFSRRFFDDEHAVEVALANARDYPWPQSSAAFTNQVRAMSAFDCSDRLSEIAAETLVIGGREDLLFPAADCRSLAERIPGAACTMIEGAAHSIHLEQPQAFCRALSGFLDKA
jgi:pimeloyl-ACP methyl ester carboxylesterase